MSKQITTESFVKELKTIWGNRYDFSRVKYVNAKTKVCVICPIHGEFWALPQSLKTSGCRKCAIEKNTFSTDEFIKKAREVHGNKYDYSKVQYINAHTKICIICPEHGEFWQKPNSHLSGCGCNKCGIERARDKMLMAQNEFIKRAKEIHGNKYDYSKVEYVNNRTKVCIICPIHGEFWQTPYSHLIGGGCRKCANKKLSKERTLTTNEFIKRAKEIHGDKYDYSKTIYTGYYNPVTIVCPTHGDFTQLAYDHLHGKGCKKCKMSHLENRINQLLAKNNIKFEFNYKPEFLKKGRSWRSLDFWLEEYDLAIECQGVQHFSDAPFYKKTYEEAYQRDVKKYDDCKNNGIKILYFSNYIIDDYIDKVFNDENELLNEILKHEKRLL